MLLTILFNTHSLPKNFTYIPDKETLEYTLSTTVEGESIWIVTAPIYSDENEIFNEYRELIKNSGYHLTHFEIQRDLTVGEDQKKLIAKRLVIKIKKL